MTRHKSPGLAHRVHLLCYHPRCGRRVKPVKRRTILTCIQTGDIHGATHPIWMTRGIIHQPFKKSERRNLQIELKVKHFLYLSSFFDVVVAIETYDFGDHKSSISMAK
jgi:hypothetical protein